VSLAGPLPRSSSRRPLSRDVVVAAAAELVDAHGIEALTLTRLAESLGVTQPALYNHVRSAADCLYALALLARQQLLAELRDAAVARSGEEAVRAVADAWRSYVHKHPGLYAATDRHPLAGYPELEAAVHGIVMLLCRVVKGYGVSDEDAEHAAWSLRAALHGFVVLEAQQGHPAALPLNETFSRLVRLLCSGLGRNGSSSDLRTSTSD
jgi:AcrR family transcriptional regulator